MNKLVRELRYQRLLKQCQTRHKKVVNNTTIEKSIDWNKLNNHFKKSAHERTGKS